MIFHYMTVVSFMGEKKKTNGAKGTKR